MRLRSTRNRSLEDPQRRSLNDSYLMALRWSMAVTISISSVDLSSATIFYGHRRTHHLNWMCCRYLRSLRGSKSRIQRFCVHGFDSLFLIRLSWAKGNANAMLVLSGFVIAIRPHFVAPQNGILMIYFYQVIFIMMKWNEMCAVIITFAWTL